MTVLGTTASKTNHVQKEYAKKYREDIFNHYPQHDFATERKFLNRNSVF
jgi:hypothetical protein